MEAYGAAPALSAGTKAGMRPMRIALVAGAILISMMAALVFLAGDDQSYPIEDVVGSPEDRLSSLVTDMARHSDTMSVTEMEQKLEAWRSDPSTMLDLPDPARMQMLADMDSSVEFHTTSLADDSTLCAKKDLIMAKFDQLLKKLGGEELSLNISNNKINSEFKAALASWLDSESNYRLTVEKAKEATEGADYARQQYEKFNTAYKDAKRTLDRILAQNAEERASLLDERELIKQIMRMIGILHDVEATDKSIAAGGMNSEKGEFGVSDPYAIKKAVSRAQLSQKIKELEAISLKVQQPKMGQMLHQLKSSLAQYAESEEVAKILKQMLQDIEDRMRIIDNLAASAKKTADECVTDSFHWNNFRSHGMCPEFFELR
jgi:alkylhydroperoxidase/carboxymuconolactone decarboxylase family protein YurZ